MRVIYRYSARRLYDTEVSHYVNLGEIAELIRSGEEIRVFDKKTQRDITSETLCQIIFEQIKRQPNPHVQSLRRIIVSGLIE